MNKYHQYPLTMWLRGLSAGVCIGLAGLSTEALFPTGIILLIICWVIAGIYQKTRDMEEVEKSREEARAAERRLYEKR